MKLIDLRLESQRLAEAEMNTPGGLTARMGAIQAQDFSMACYAIGIRLRNAREKDILAAINRGEIVRTHVLRPTWHFVASEDLGWMLRLTGPAIKRTMLAAERTVGLNEKYFLRSTRLIEKTLIKRGPTTREDLKVVFQEAGLDTGMNLPAHMLMHAELDGVICSGPVLDGKTTFTLVSDWVPEDKSLSRDESLAELAQRYFNSHGPASLRDFSWWSGLNLSDCRKALTMVQQDLNTMMLDGADYWFSKEPDAPKSSMYRVHLLPAYDEYLISYKDRSSVLPMEKFHTAVSNNGVFRPVILLDGKVIGTWKRAKVKNSLKVDILPFSRITRQVRELAGEAALRYGDYTGMKVMIGVG